MSGQAFVVVGTAAGTTITVERQSVSGERPQGLVLDADHPMTVGDHQSASVVLWSDTAPARTELITSEGGELRIWHVWREGELMQAWEGDAFVVVDDEGDDLGLECHDNHPGDEIDLAVRVSFDRSWTQPDDPDHVGP